MTMKCSLKAVNFSHNLTAMTILKMDYDVSMHLNKAKKKPRRRLKRRDSSYLIEQSQGLFKNKPGQFFYNPTDHQLDKIMNGELWGYRL